VSDLARQRLGPHTFACVQSRKGLGFSNSGLISAGGGLVVDTLYDLALTRRLVSLYAEVHPAAPRRLLNTHHNGDHCWGNQLFPKAEIIAHAGCARRFEDFTPAAAETIRTMDDPPAHLRTLHDDFAPFSVADIELTPPTTVLDDDTALDLDGVLVNILYVGPAHTEGDLIVHVPSDGVVFAGDVLFNQCAPIGWEGTTSAWIDALLRIERLEPEYVVPGHGPVCDVSGVRGLRTYFEDVRRHATLGWRNGESVLTCCAGIDLAPYAGWDEHWRLAANVHRIYRECAGLGWNEPVDSAAVMADVEALRRRLSD
jgi:cyclase